jgi:hypothetical protein
MNIISETKILMVGANPQGFPCPQILPNVNIQAAYMVACNLGPCDVFVAVGQTPGVGANETSQLIGAASYAGPPGFLRNPSATAIGPYVAIPLNAGDRFFSAVAIPIQVTAAFTNGTADSGSTTVTVDSSTGIAIGQSVSDWNNLAIALDTVVTNVVGTTVTLSQATTAALSETALQFSVPPSVQPPGVLAVCLGI